MIRGLHGATELQIEINRERTRKRKRTADERGCTQISVRGIVEAQNEICVNLRPSAVRLFSSRQFMSIRGWRSGFGAHALQAVQ
jgi:hypothetical protein